MTGKGRSLAKQGFLDPSAAKAWAGVQALSFGKEMGLSRLILEGDAKVVVNAVNFEATDWSKIGHLVEDMKMLLSDFSQWQVKGVGFAINSVAHTIAKMATREGVDRTWLGTFP